MTHGALGRATSYTYDADNRQTQVTYPDGSASKTGYDALGRKTSSTDSMNQTTTYGYDTLGHLTSVTDPSGNVTAYTYDAVGNELTQKDALGRTTSYAYNLANRRTSRTLPAGQSESYTYDAVGDMLMENNFNGQTVTYTYDPETSRLTGKSGAGLADTYSYDADGERTGMTDNSGSTSYTYDERGRVTQKSGPEGTLNYTYDSHGNLLGLQSGTSNGLNETFTYDADNRLSTFTDGRIGGTTNYGYDQDGNLMTLAYPNNLSTAYTYDTLDRLTGMNTQNTQGNSVVAAYAYTLRADGLRTGVTDSGPATSGRTDNWQYDPLDRLTQEAVTGASTVNGTSAFTYDSSNRLTRNSTIQGVSNFSETYNANDQRADEGFDNNGGTTGTNGNAYTFDAEGKLTGATLVTPTTESLTLVYDGDGNLASKANGSVTTTYLVDTNNPSGYAQIVEAKTNGALTDVFNYGTTGIISQGHIPTGTTAYFGKDGSNNTRYLTDSQTGNVTDTMDYTADGIQVSRTGNFPLMHQFQGEYLDPDLNLYDLRARWMNPQTGEFMTMDTYEGDNTDPQSLHKYAFVKWDGGVNQSDPSGNDPESGVNWAADFDFINMAQTFGSTVATLVGVVTGNDVTTPNTLASRAATLVGYFQEASQQTGISMNVLGSLGWSESGWITSEVEHNDNGTTDYGIMQLNSATNGSNAVASPDKANILYGAEELAHDKKTAEAAITRGYLRVNGIQESTKSYNASIPNNVNFLAVWLYKGLNPQGYANANTWFNKYYLSWPLSEGVPPSVQAAWGNQ